DVCSSDLGRVATAWVVCRGPLPGDKDQGSPASQNVAAEVLVLNDLGQLLLDVSGVDAHGLLLEIRSFERDLIQKLFHDGMQAPRADILGLLVDRCRQLRDFLQRIIRKRQLDALGLEQGRVLLYQRALRLLQNADEVLDRERIQFDADREAPLKL